ncbi:MAG: hypothetical protein R3E60_02435 [Alphaproteobacteria bacterium]
MGDRDYTALDSPSEPDDQKDQTRRFGTIELASIDLFCRHNPCPGHMDTLARRGVFYDDPLEDNFVTTCEIACYAGHCPLFSKERIPLPLQRKNDPK